MYPLHDRDGQDTIGRRPYPSLEAALEALFGRSVAVTERLPVGGGCISNATVLQLEGGDRLFLKEQSRAMGPLFRAEVEGLRALRTLPGPPIPEPLALIEGRDSQGLLLEYIASGRPRPDWERTLGRAVAQMHRSEVGASYGFEHSNFIGSTLQINTPEQSWPKFFALNRLEPQIELARRHGLADGSLIHAVERIMERIEDLLREPEQPSMLHGDLWNGNVMVAATGEAVLIDPAVYRGDREADVAMTELFGGFGSAFYRGYDEVFPRDTGYARRRDLYNLYHILNHLNLFGIGYASQARAMASRFNHL